MDCQEIQELLVPYLQGDLSDAGRSALEAHLRTCADCQKEKVLFEKTWGMLDGFQAPQVSSNFTADLMAKIREQRPAQPEFVSNAPEINTQIIFWVLALALVFVCVIGGGYLFIRNHSFHQQQRAQAVLSEENTVTQAEENAPAQAQELVAPNKEMKPAVKSPVSDAEIIRNLDAFENSELYKNLPLFNDLDVVQNLGAKGPVL